MGFLLLQGGDGALLLQGGDGELLLQGGDGAVTPSVPAGTFRRPLWSWPRVWSRDSQTFRRVFARPLKSWGRVWRWVMPNNMLDTVELTKTVSDDRDFAIDFSKAPELATGTGITISSAAVSGGSGLTFGSPAVLAASFDGIAIGKGISVQISGGDDDATYKFAIVATLSNGRKLTVPCRLAVAADYE